MTKKHLLFSLILVLICSKYSWAQEDSLYIQSLLDSAKKIWTNQPREALKYIAKGDEIVQQKKLMSSQFNIWHSKGLCYYYLGHYDSLIFYEQKALGLLEEDSTIYILPKNIAAAYNNSGIGSYRTDNYPKALEYNLKALIIREKINSPKLSSTYNNLGLVYMALKQHTKAIEFFEKSLQLKQKANNQIGIANTLNNIGMVYKDIRHAKNAKQYYLKSLAVSKEINDAEKMSNVLGNLGQLAFWKDNYKEAISYYEESVRINEIIDNQSNVVQNIRNIAQMYLELDDAPKAKKYLDKAKKIALVNNINTQWVDIYNLYSNYYALVGNSDSSSFYYLQHKQLYDSIQTLKNQNTILDIESKYKNKEQAQQIAILEQKEQISELELNSIRNQRTLVIIFIILLLIVIAVLYKQYQYRSKTNQQLKELNHTKDKLFSIIGHDLKNPLIGFKSITTSLNANLDKLEGHEVQFFIGKLDKGAQQLYLLVQNLLQWAMAQNQDLKPNIQSVDINKIAIQVFNLFKINAEKKDVYLINEIPINTVVPTDAKIIQTIVRNLVDNAIKFTPKEGEVTISYDEQTSKIIIRDTGIGMTPEELRNVFIDVASIKNSDKKGTGLGLSLCKELAQKQGGDLLVESEKNKGTTFSILLDKKYT